LLPDLEPDDAIVSPDGPESIEAPDFLDDVDEPYFVITDMEDELQGLLEPALEQVMEGLGHRFSLSRRINLVDVAPDGTDSLIPAFMAIGVVAEESSGWLVTGPSGTIAQIDTTETTIEGMEAALAQWCSCFTPLGLAGLAAAANGELGEGDFDEPMGAHFNVLLPLSGISTHIRQGEEVAWLDDLATSVEASVAARSLADTTASFQFTDHEGNRYLWGHVATDEEDADEIAETVEQAILEGLKDLTPQRRVLERIIIEVEEDDDDDEIEDDD
jgi:hypothetical protein